MSDISQERTLGRIEATLSTLVQQQTALATAVAKIEAQMAVKSESLALEGAEVKNRLNDIESELRNVKPALQEMEVWKERGRGAMILGSFIMASFGATIATFWTKLVSMISGGQP